MAVLSENRPEWHIGDFAILLSGLVSVPVYTEFSPAQIRFVLEHSAAAAILVSTGALWAAASSNWRGLPALRGVVLFESGNAGPSAAALPDIIAAKAPADFVAQVTAAAVSTRADTLATIVYTSGTTGSPKGVMLTHRNIASNLAECIQRLGFRSVERSLSVLPLAHVFERLLCYGYFQMGVPIAYGDPHDLAELLPAHQPVAMGCVPRILEKIRENVFDQIRRERAPRQTVARMLLRIGHAHIGQSVFRREASPAGRMLYPLADRLLYRKLHRKLGGALRYMICGGAKLEQPVEEFFLAAGIVVLQGYGLTETSPVISLSPHDAIKPGTVGKPLDNLNIVFDQDGELLVRGPSVFGGYCNNPALTSEAFAGEWLRTGDLARLDSDGYLVIEGRKKEMLVTSGGKNVHPAPIEDRLRESPFIRQAFVVGDGRKFVAALIVPEMAEVVRAAGRLQLKCSGEAELLDLPAIRQLCWNDIERLQDCFSLPERVKKFAFIADSAASDPELFTPTQKLRRAVLEKKFAAAIGGLYDSSIAPPPAVTVP